MTQKKIKRNLIEGTPALIIIDIQKDSFQSREGEAIPTMEGFAERMLLSRKLIDTARENDIPIIFIQEIHRSNLVDFGRELDGAEDVHCLDNCEGTQIAEKQMGFLPTDYLVKKRRYSAFFGTDFEILLKGLKVNTLILCGALTDVCVHYTFVDGHQSDYFCRVVEDCVAGSSIEAHEASLRAMEYLQTGARCSIESVLKSMEDYA